VQDTVVFCPGAFGFGAVHQIAVIDNVSSVRTEN
jgi:hypothetical protein